MAAQNDGPWQTAARTSAPCAVQASAAMAAEAWTAQGAEVRAAVCQGPSFWAAIEIEEAPRLIEASLAALSAEADFAARPTEAESA